MKTIIKALILSLIFGIFLLVVINNISAVTINNSVLNTTISHSSITFDIMLNMTNASIFTTNITLLNVTCPNGKFIPIYVWNTLDKDIKSSEICVISQGGGTGGISYNVGRICNYSYLYIINYSDMQLQNYSNLIYDKFGEYITPETFDFYIKNWQYYCSDLMNKSLQEEFICNSIKSSSNELDNYKISILKEEINKKIYISENLLKSYINDKNRCNLIITKKIKTLNKTFFVPDCQRDLNLSIYMGNYSFSLDSYFNFIDIDFNNLSCEDINFYRWFFKINKEDTFIGIKYWWIIFFEFLTIFLGLIILLLYITKIMEKLKNNKDKIKERIKQKWKKE